MKKRNLLMVILCICAITMFGQIRVDENGKAYFGSNSTGNYNHGTINIVEDGVRRGISISGTSGSIFKLFKIGANAYITRGTTLYSGMRISEKGTVSISPGNLDRCPSGAVLNLFNANSSTIHSKFLYDLPVGDAIKSEVNNPLSNAFTVYLGSSSPYEQTFYVRGEGIVYAKNGYIQSSDISNKTEIVNLSSALNRITSLRAVSFKYKGATTEAKNTLSKYRSLPSDSLSPNFSIDAARQMEREISRKRIGLVAQEVETVVPEVVRTLPDGKKGIMYSDLVGLLVEGIKELRDSLDIQTERLNDFQQQLDDIKILITNMSSDDFISFKKKIDSSLNKVSAVLYQNTPNPFNQETEIKYQIPSNVSASICVYSLSGQQLKKYPLVEANGKIVVSASEFSAGIYIYSLIVNNQEVDSKRMILTD